MHNTMFLIFQKLRQSLINEGHLRKYSVYAIGEILLVVVGILIALQINRFDELITRMEEIQVLIEADINS
jgi:hypothetical protein